MLCMLCRHGYVHFKHGSAPFLERESSPTHCLLAKMWMEAQVTFSNFLCFTEGERIPPCASIMKDYGELKYKKNKNKKKNRRRHNMSPRYFMWCHPSSRICPSIRYMYTTYRRKKIYIYTVKISRFRNMAVVQIRRRGA